MKLWFLTPRGLRIHPFGEVGVGWHLFVLTKVPRRIGGYEVLACKHKDLSQVPSIHRKDAEVGRVHLKSQYGDVETVGSLGLAGWPA